MDDKVVKLVTRNPRVADLAGLAQSLRDLADEIESGGHGDLESVIMLMETSQGGLERYSLTTSERLDRARVAGLFAYAQHMVICPND